MYCPVFGCRYVSPKVCQLHPQQLPILHLETVASHCGVPFAVFDWTHRATGKLWQVAPNMFPFKIINQYSIYLQNLNKLFSSFHNNLKLPLTYHMNSYFLNAPVSIHKENDMRIPWIGY